MKIKEYLIDNYLLNPEDKINLFFFIGPDTGLTDQRVTTLCKTLKIDNNNPFNVSKIDQNRTKSRQKVDRKATKSQPKSQPKSWKKSSKKLKKVN